MSPEEAAKVEAVQRVISLLRARGFTAHLFFAPESGQTETEPATDRDDYPLWPGYSLDPGLAADQRERHMRLSLADAERSPAQRAKHDASVDRWLREDTWTA